MNTPKSGKMFMRWAMSDGTVISVDKINLLTDLREDEIEIPGVWELPKGWSGLQWYKVVMSPCLYGDDLRMALDTSKKVGYVIHDCNCQSYPWSGDVKSFIKKETEDPTEG